MSWRTKVRESLLGMALVVCACQSDAALTIQNTDISAGHYLYDLNFADMNTATIFNQDVWQVSNASHDNAWGARHIRANDVPSGLMNAQFILRFDFTSTLYRPTHLDLRDNLAAFRNNDANENTTSSTWWSTDNVQYQLITTITSPRPPDPLGVGKVGTLSIDLNQPATVYYKVTFVNNGLPDVNGFSWLQNQWNRQMDANGDYFRVDFAVSLIPEPAALTLLALGALALNRRRR